MNDVSQEKKDSVLKSLAIAGFIGTIILIAWLSIQLVSFIPGAFSSLASLADGLSQYKQTAEQSDSLTPITVTSNTTLVKAGDTVELSWTNTLIPGSYTFSYKCTDGIAVDITNVDGIRSIACDTNYNIGNINSLSLTIDSEKERYAVMSYTITFLGTNDSDPIALGTSSVTVINSEISSILVINETKTEESSSVTEPVVETPVITEPVVETPVETTPEVATSPNPKPATPVYEQEFVYTLPTSDPNGRTDISTRFLNTGTIVGNTFFTGAIRQNETGAIQFEVKNLGTKTSEDWTFAVTMPNGSTYNSIKQVPLKPNERAVLTIGFTTTNDASHTFIVTTNESSDNTPLNDRFSQTVTFVK